MEQLKTVRADILAYVKKQYGTDPEYPFMRDPDTAILRQKGNSKWYGIMLHVRADRLGLPGDGLRDILDVKCDPALIGSLIGMQGYYPAYHMNKNHWLSVALDGSVPVKKILGLVDLSYELTGEKRGAAT